MYHIKRFLEVFDDFYNKKKVKKVLSTNKIKHSKRVADYCIELTNDQDLIDAALYHDYLERGGKEVDLKKILSKNAYDIVICLTNKDKQNTLNKLKNVLKGKNQNFINDVLLVKLCDRADNIKKRYDSNNLTETYIDKTNTLVKWILSKYTGKDIAQIKKFIDEKINKYL